jgi:hypothetical protein
LAPTAGLEPATRRLTVQVAGSQNYGIREKQPVRETRSREIERATRLTAHSTAQSVAVQTDRDGDGESHLARPGENDANGGSLRDPEVILKEAIARLTRTLLTVPDDAIPGLVAERAALRAELRQLSENAAVRLDDETRKPPGPHDG